VQGVQKKKRGAHITGAEEKRANAIRKKGRQPQNFIPLLAKKRWTSLRTNLALVVCGPQDSKMLKKG